MYNHKLKKAIVRFVLRAGKRLFGSDLVNRIYLTDLNIGVKKNDTFEKRLSKNYWGLFETDFRNVLGLSLISSFFFVFLSQEAKWIISLLT